MRSYKYKSEKPWCYVGLISKVMVVKTMFFDEILKPWLFQHQKEMENGKSGKYQWKDISGWVVEMPKAFCLIHNVKKDIAEKRK